MKYSWIAFDQSYREVVEKQLELKKIDGESGLCGVPVKDGKIAIYGPLEYFEKKTLQELSTDCCILLVDYSDTVSFSSCTFFENGKIGWSVEADGDDVMTEGSPPDKLKQIQEEFEWRETEPNYLIPAKLGAEIIGIEENSDMESTIYYELNMSYGF